jgi:hypothetical protein
MRLLRGGRNRERDEGEGDEGFPHGLIPTRRLFPRDFPAVKC